MANPLAALLSGGGLAFYGGLILGAALVIRYIVKKKIPLLAAIDACAPALVAGYGVGRIGCQLSGDGDWGKVNAAAKPGWLSWLALAVILAAAWGIPSGTPYPGGVALGPTLAAAWLLSQPGTSLHRLLSLRPLAFVGSARMDQGVAGEASQ